MDIVTTEATGDEMMVYLPRPMVLGSYLKYVDRMLGGMDALLVKAKERAIKENRLLGKVRDFQIEDPSAAGLARALGKTTRELAIRMAEGEAAIRQEFKDHGTDVDQQCLNYVIDGTAGSDATEFWNGKMDQKRSDEYGITLDDFVAKEEARAAGLDREEVIALRVYTTAAYKSLNEPFHHGGTGGSRVAHGFPATIGFLASGIKKLRGNDKSGATFDLFRGMANVNVSSDESSGFLQNGGTHGAPMSASRDMETAVRYAASESMLLLKIKTGNFRQRGADISFLSAFPEEKEILYPPGTYLQPQGQPEEHRMGRATIKVIELVPDIE